MSFFKAVASLSPAPDPYSLENWDNHGGRMHLVLCTHFTDRLKPEHLLQYSVSKELLYAMAINNDE